MEKDLGKVKKNDTTDIIIRIDDFGGKKGVTIREYVTSDKYTGFTKSGTRIAAESFKSFKDLINSIDENDLKPEEKPETEKPAAKQAKPAKEKKKKEMDVSDVPDEDLL